MNTDRFPNLEEIQARRKAIAEEDSFLMEMERVALKWREYQAGTTAFMASGKTAPPSLVSGSTVNRYKKSKKRTKNDMIIEALNSPRTLWQSAKQIREFISTDTGKDVPMTSISPALSNLKNIGTIQRNDLYVALTLRVDIEEPDFFKENGEASASPETTAEAEPLADLA